MAHYEETEAIRKKSLKTESLRYDMAFNIMAYKALRF